MIQHTVVFRLKAPLGSPEEARFMESASALATIDGVRDFKAHRQTSKKNNFDFGFTMFFASEADYQSYNDHPDHVAFVNNIWLPEVEEFMEIDYEEMQ